MPRKRRISPIEESIKKKYELARYKNRPCDFWKLPPELRLMIWELVYTNAEGLTEMNRKPLLAALRQEGKLYWEALDIYYESTVMELDSLTFSQFRDDLNIENIRRIKGLIVTLRSDDSPEFKAFIPHFRQPRLALAEKIVKILIVYDFSTRKQVSPFIKEFLKMHGNVHILGIFTRRLYTIVTERSVWDEDGQRRRNIDLENGLLVASKVCELLQKIPFKLIDYDNYIRWQALRLGYDCIWWQAAYGEYLSIGRPRFGEESQMMPPQLQRWIRLYRSGR